jgi:hypothetical protein
MAFIVMTAGLRSFGFVLARQRGLPRHVVVVGQAKNALKQQSNARQQRNR